jgi:uncharacterized membrane protein
MKHTIIAFLITAFVFIIGLGVCNGNRATEDLKLHCTYLKQDMCVIKGSEKDSIETVDISKINQSEFTVGQDVVYKVETPKEQYNESLLFLIIISIIVFVIARFFHYIFRIDFLHSIDF